MSLATLLKRLAHRQSEAGGLARDAFWVSLWQGAISVADLVQLALITRVLGLSDYGRLALVIALVTLISQFFDFRVGTAATMFSAQMVETKDVRGAAGIFQLSYIVDLLTGIVGFAVVAAASFVGVHVVGGSGQTLILLYALTLLISTVDDSSTALLRVFKRFGLLAGYRVALEGARIGLVAVAVFGFHSLVAVVLALVAYDFLSALANAVAAAVVYRRESGESLLVPAFSRVRHVRRTMLRTVIHTNVVSYARLAMTQLPTVLLGVFAGPATVGVFKVGMAAAIIPGRIADPAYGAVLPRLSRLWAGGQFAQIRRLLKHSSAISFPAMAIVTAVVLLLRHPTLHLLAGVRHGSGEETVLAIAIVASAINGALFWNVSVLFASWRSRLVAQNAVSTVVVQVVLLLALVPSLKATGAAIAYLVSVVFNNARLTWFALRAVRVDAEAHAARPLADEAVIAAVADGRTVLS